MKKTKLISSGFGILIIGLLIGRFILPKDSHSEHETTSTGPESADTIWTCSMDPQIQQSEPGDCPICGMTLIPLLDEGSADLGPREMRMSDSSKALADIQTTLVTRQYPEAEIRMVGKLNYDETLVKSLTARFPARIDELFVNFKGIPVAKGDHLAKVYSPDLLSAQRELLTAFRIDPNSSITNAAREKLRLWDLVPEQIDAILESGEAKDHFVLKAPIGGVVVVKNVKEGDYVKTGETLFKIVDLSRLWAYLDAYESDLPWLRYGQEVSLSVEAMPGEIIQGQIVFIEPEVNLKTRTIPIRVNVANPDGKLKPGMFVRGIVASRLAEDGKVYAPEFAGKWISPMHPEVIKDGPGQCDVCGMDLVPAETLGYVDNNSESAPIVIPTSAVLRTGKRAVVYVEKPNTDMPTYEGREIVLGPRAGDYYLVTTGLDVGERVVTHGAFKIDSSLQIQAKPSMMNPKGGGPAPGHNHGGEIPKGSKMDETMDMGTDALKIPAALCPQLLPLYLEMQAALALDDLDAAKAQAKAMMKITGHTGPVPELLHHLTGAADLDSFRKPGFDHLSQAIIQSLTQSSDTLKSKLYIMSCPMVYGDTGASWLQATDKLRNPYFGAAMLTCGETIEVLGK